MAVTARVLWAGNASVAGTALVPAYITTLPATRRPLVAAARWLGSAKRPDDDRRGAADAGVDGDRAGGTVHRARAAFHARGEVGDPCPTVLDDKDRVWTDVDAHSAAVALLAVERETGDVR